MGGGYLLDLSHHSAEEGGRAEHLMQHPWGQWIEPHAGAWMLLLGWKETNSERFCLLVPPQWLQGAPCHTPQMNTQLWDTVLNYLSNGHPSWGWLNVEDALPVLFMSSFLKSKRSYRDPVDGALPPRLREMEFKQIHCYCDF